VYLVAIQKCSDSLLERKMWLGGRGVRYFLSSCQKKKQTYVKNGIVKGKR
jgi:hypothetical protein